MFTEQLMNINNKSTYDVYIIGKNVTRKTIFKEKKKVRYCYPANALKVVILIKPGRLKAKKKE